MVTVRQSVGVCVMLKTKVNDEGKKDKRGGEARVKYLSVQP